MKVERIRIISYNKRKFKMSDQFDEILTFKYSYGVSLSLINFVIALELNFNNISNEFYNISNEFYEISEKITTNILKNFMI